MPTPMLSMLDASFGSPRPADAPAGTAPTVIVCHINRSVQAGHGVALNEFEGAVMLVSHDRALDDYQRYLLDDFDENDLTLSMRPPKRWSLDFESAIRLPWLGKLSAISSFEDVEGARQAHGATLALLRPARVLGLDITPVADPSWTDEEKAKLIRLQQQGALFDDSDMSSLAQLRKLPYDFHYRYECLTPTGPVEYRHKIVDWEIGALYWKVHRTHGKAWEGPFRDKLESFLPARDLMFLMGTIHRFPDRWLVVSLIYPPRQPPSQGLQGSLF